MKIDRSRIYVHDTIHPYSFIGNLRKPFSILVWLASKAVPAGSKPTAGFVFYQNQDGFNFVSIDDMIKQESVATYVYTEVSQSEINRNNDFRILSYTTDKNENLVEKLRLGTFASHRMYFNPLNFRFTDPAEGLFKLKSDEMDNLGREVELPPVSDDSDKKLNDIPSRILSGVVDIGTMNRECSKEPNADPGLYQSQAIMRYNVLFTQTLSMTVPCNTDLKAGDIITCEFPKISRSDSGELDGEISGKYIIKELCRHFEPDGSYTSMKLIRDTFGFYGQ